MRVKEPDDCVWETSFTISVSLTMVVPAAGVAVTVTGMLSPTLNWAPFAGLVIVTVVGTIAPVVTVAVLEAADSPAPL